MQRKRLVEHLTILKQGLQMYADYMKVNAERLLRAPLNTMQFREKRQSKRQKRLDG